MTDTVTRFWNQVDKGGGCWLWTGSRSHRGYGQFCTTYEGHKFWKAHRFSWYIHNGEIPKGMYVLHTCDNPWCVNPEHLWLGTHAENQIDKVNKMRHQHGERVHTAKLTEGQVLEILASDERYEDIAVRYSIHPGHVSKIKTGRAWKHLQDAGLDRREQ